MTGTMFSALKEPVVCGQEILATQKGVLNLGGIQRPGMPKGGTDWLDLAFHQDCGI